MERHIFKFGKNSVAFIIPKKWADKNDLKAGSAVLVEENESGDIIISGSATAKSENEIVINPSMTPELVSRWVGLHYMYGTEKLRIYSSSGMTPEQVKSIAEKIRDECSGFEITSQSNNEIIIEGFTDIKEVDIERVIMRIRALISQEFIELKRGTVEVVPDIEKLVNRFYMLGVRYINITKTKDSVTNFAILSLMEDISDKLDEASRKQIKGTDAVLTELGNAFAACHKASEGDLESISSVLDAKNNVLKALSGSKIYGETVALLVAVAYDISNIAEFGLMKEKDGGSLAI
jgi:phosphate uptake regulator